MEIRWMRNVLAAAGLAVTVAAGMACGGGAAGGAKAAAPGEGTAASGEEDPFDFCTRYRGCAEEESRLELMGEDMPPMTAADLKAKTEEKVAECRATTKGYSAEQIEWMRSCSDCGGDCSVFTRCMLAPNPVVEPFTCSMGSEGEGGEGEN